MIAAVAPRGVWLACLLLLSGCVTSPPKQAHQFRVVAQPLHLSIGTLADNAALRSFCEAADQAGCIVNPHDLQAFTRAWLDSERFASVAVDNAEADYKLLLGTALQQTDARADRRELHYRAVLTWNGELIREAVGRMPAANASDKSMEEALAGAIETELDQQSAFSAPVLHAALASDDYRAELKLPSLIGEFQRVESHIFHHPLLGAQSRYSDPALEAGRIDVYVYPVQAATWLNAEAILRAEAERVQQDMAMLRQNGVWAQYAVSSPVVRQWLVAGTATPVLYFSGEYADQQYQPFDTYTYLALREDKYIKLRASIPRNAGGTDIDGFARQLLDAISVPPESRFMQRVRAAW